MGIEFIMSIVSSFLIIHWISRRLPLKLSINFQIITCFVVLFVFFCLRDLSVLNDTSHYYKSQYNLLKYTSAHADVFKPYHARYEYLFQVWTNIIANYIWKDAYAIIFITSLLVIVSNIWFLSRYTRNISLAIFLNFPYLLFMNSANRQAYAIMIFYVAIIFLLSRKYIYYYILILIAVFFHQSAFILLFLPVFSKINFTRKNIIYLFIGGSIISIFIYPFLTLLGYGDNHYFLTNSARETAPLAQILNFLWAILMLCIIYYCRKKYNIKFPYVIFSWLSILYCIWELIGIPFLIFARYASYFQMIIIIELLYSLYKVSDLHTDISYISKKIIPRANFIGLLIILCLLKMYILTEYRNEWFHLIPYSFYDFEPGYHDYNLGY